MPQKMPQRMPSRTSRAVQSSSQQQLESHAQSQQSLTTPMQTPLQRQVQQQQQQQQRQRASTTQTTSKKRSYTAMPDGIPEAAAYLVLDLGYNVSYVARILHVQRTSISRRIKKIKDARDNAQKLHQTPSSTGAPRAIAPAAMEDCSSVVSAQVQPVTTTSTPIVAFQTPLAAAAALEVVSASTTAATAAAMNQWLSLTPTPFTDAVVAANASLTDPK